jgi:hypothetical protein
MFLCYLHQYTWPSASFFRVIYVSDILVTHMVILVDLQLEEEESDNEAIVGGSRSSAPLAKRRKNIGHPTMQPTVANAAGPVPMIPAANTYAGLRGPPQGGGMAVPYQASNWMLPQGGSWVPSQGGGWVLAAPGHYMQLPPMPDGSCGLQSNPETSNRSSRKTKRKRFDVDSRERTAARKKPYQIRVKAGREINGGCNWKNAWDFAVRSTVPRTLDMSILS